MRCARLLLPAALLTLACTSTFRAPAPMRPEITAGSGLVLLYDETGSTMRWASVGIEGRDGRFGTLALEPRQEGPGRERRTLLAAGPVPSGTYTNLVLSRPVKDAEPEEVRVPLTFDVTDRGGVVLALSGGSGADFAAKVAPRSATGTTGFAACPAGGYVAMFDKRSGRVFGALPTGRGPSSIALDLDRRRVYVAVAEEHAIEVIDLDQGAVLERRTLRSGDAPADLVVTPDGNTLLVAARGSSTLVFVDARSLSENDRIEVPTGPVSVVVDRQGLRAYVASRAANAVSSIDLVARRLIRSASVDAEPVRLQLDAAQTTLWVLHDVAPYLFGVDTRSLETTTRLNLGPGGTAFRLEPRTGRLLVARRDGGGIDAYDPFSRLPVENFATDGRVTYLSADAESNLLFAARPDASGITAYGLVGRAAAWSSDLGCAPAFIAVPGER